MATNTKDTIGEVILKNVRLSFADLYKPGKPMKNDKGEEQAPKYKANFLIDPTTEDGKANIAKLKAAAEQVKKAKWGNNLPKLKPDRVFLRDGNLESWDGYEGMQYVSANNPQQPGLVTNQKDENGKWQKAAPGVLYSGCYVNAIIRIWAQDSTEYGKRLNASLEVVQFRKRGAAFGAAPVDPNEKFGDDFEGEDEDGDIGGEGYTEEEDSLV